jgi:hypothetical protein
MIVATLALIAICGPEGGTPCPPGAAQAASQARHIVAQAASLGNLSATLLCLHVGQAVPPSISIFVEGEGYIRFAKQGRILYAKSATLVSRNGKVCDASGASLMPLVSAPPDATSIEVDFEGQVTVRTATALAGSGRIVLGLFPEGTASQPADGLLAISGRPKLANPGEGLAGVIRAKGSATALAPATAQPDGRKLRVQIAGSVEVESERISLGSIADIAGPALHKASASQIDLGITPPSNVALRITRDRIVAKLALAGIQGDMLDAAIPAIVEVRRKAQRVEHSRFVEAAVQAVQAKLGVQAACESNESQSDFLAPTGALVLRAEDVSASGSSGSFTVRVAVVVDGKRINARNVRLSAQGLELGVQAGSTVKVRFLSGAIVCEATGRAKTGGYVGQTAEVAVTLGEPAVVTIHTGLIKAPGVVEVKL